MQPDNIEILRALLAGTNINANSFLATDYLNHFNEIIMLIDMIPDVPECLEDAQEWRPRNYIEHFEASSFSDKALAVKAYHTSLPRYREPLEEISRRLNDRISGLLAVINILAGENRLDTSAELIEPASHEVKIMIQLASAVINGESDVTTAADVEQLLAQTSREDIGQDEIDKLF